MSVISDSSPLIALAQIDRLDLMHGLFEDILIPPAVAREINRTLPSPPEWLRMRKVALPFQPRTVSSSIGPGEREVISLGLEIRAGWLVLDEQPARRLAIAIGLRVIGTIGLLLAAKNRGLLPNIKPELERLLLTGFFIGRDLYNRAIRQADE